MKRILLTMLLAVLFFCPSLALAAGTATITVNWMSSDEAAFELKWDCLADAAGNISAPSVTWDTWNAEAPPLLWKYARRIDRVIIVPDAGGTQPDDLYDIEVRVSSSITSDLLGGLGDNLSDTNTSMDAPLTEANGYPMFVTETPVIYGENIGASNGCTIYILFHK